MTETFLHRSGEDVVFYAAPRSFGRTLLRSDVTAIAFRVAKLSAPDTDLYTATYYVAAEPSTGDYTQAMFDSLQTGNEWPHSSGGYSLAIVHDASDYTFDDGEVYLVEAALTVAVGSPTWPDLSDGGTKTVQWIVDARRVV